MRSMNYNPMLMMLWNLEPNIMCISNFGLWDKTEDVMIAKAKSIQKEEKLNLGIMNMVEMQQYRQSIMTYEACDLNAMQNDSDYYVNYLINELALKLGDQEEIFSSMKNNLNVQKVVLRSDFIIANKPIDVQILTNIFGHDNVYLVNPIDSQTKIDELRKDLATGNVREYREQTGISYSHRGPVVKGKQLGRSLGYPTANVVVEYPLPIKDGVYYTSVKLPNDPTIHHAMSCYWTNELKEKVIETYIFDFDKDIYGWNIDVFFEEWIRDMRSVSSKEALIEMMQNDERTIRIKYLGENE